MGALIEAARAVSWETCVPLLRRVYAEAVASPYRSSAPRVREELEREAHIVALAASAEHDRARAAELRQANADAQKANQLAQQANHEAQQALAQTHEELNSMRASVGGFAETTAGGFSPPLSAVACCASPRARCCGAFCSPRSHSAAAAAAVRARRPTAPSV